MVGSNEPDQDDYPADHKEGLYPSLDQFLAGAHFQDHKHECQVGEDPQGLVPDPDAVDMRVISLWIYYSPLEIYVPKPQDMWFVHIPLGYRFIPPMVKDFQKIARKM